MDYISAIVTLNFLVSLAVLLALIGISNILRKIGGGNIFTDVLAVSKEVINAE